MTMRWAAALVALATLAVSPEYAGAQAAPTANQQVTALIGLARTARDQGRHAEAVRHFQAASRLRAFETALLVEYFWAAQRADAGITRDLGQQILRVVPGDAAVRDGLIGVLAMARDEAAVRSVAQAGAALDSRAALWPRRLAESFLRAGDGARAAEHFKRAASLQGGGDSDRAMYALALESTADQAGAASAWNEVDEAVWSTRPEWTDSRMRALAAARPKAVPPPVTPGSPKHARPPAARTPDEQVPTSAEIVAVSHHALAIDACATGPLAALEPLADPEPFISAVASRPATCAGQTTWAVRAGERAIGLGRFADALRMVQPAATSEDAPPNLREQHAVLLHWTGDDERAEPLLREVVAEATAPGRATDALIDVLRAKGRPDEAWPLALDRWGHASAPAERRLAVASLALETGRLDEALSRAKALDHNREVGPQARSIAASALLASGRAEEAKTMLGMLGPDPQGALTWLDAVAAMQGVTAALRAAQPVSDRVDRPWADVIARRALWHAQLGQEGESQQLLSRLDGIDRRRRVLAAAEIALGTGRPADAVPGLRELAAHPSLEFRATDLLSTALAEQEQWDEALATLAGLRGQRPHDMRLAIREASWRDRRAPSSLTLTELEWLVAAAPAVGDGPIILARAYMRSGRPYHAWAVLEEHPAVSVERRLLRAEIAAALWGAADAEFEALTSGEDADPAWYLAWADAYGNGPDARRVLDMATERFPADPLLHERLAVTAWAGLDREAALGAADIALSSDPRRLGAWFVRIAGTSGRPDETAELVDRFERQFANSPAALLDMGDMLAGLARSPKDPAARKALEWTSRIRAEQPNLDAAVVTEVRLLTALEQNQRAMSEIDALIARQPTSPEAHKLRAELLVHLGSYAEAVAAYDEYLVLAPGDLAARRQQARIEGWRGDTGSALARYEKLREHAPDVPAIEEEVAAKRAYYSGRWREALVHYEAWLALEPHESEARLEHAQSLDHLGETVLASQAYRMLSPDHRIAALAADRMESRRAPSVDFFTVGSSADGVSRQQLLDMVDAGAGFSTGIGAGHGARVRVFGGTSMAHGAVRDWRGHHAGGEFMISTASPIDLAGRVGYRKLDGVDPQMFGEAGLGWKALQSLRLALGAERSLILENGSTMVDGLAGVGPTGRLRWQPTAALSIEVAAKHLALSDDNTKNIERADLSQRVWGRSSELRLVASTEHLSYAETRETYFTPGRFWRHDAGLEWRAWLATPRFYGDRERWISATYLFGADNRDERYHTARVGVAYEFAGGVGFVADGLLVRSRVYDGASVSVGLRLKHVPAPGR